MKILHVEDDIMIGKAMSRVLRSTNEVTTVSKVEDVPADLKQYDLVVTDMDLPAPKEGLKVVAAATAQGVLCLVYSSNENARKEASAAGAMGFISKPDTQELVKAINAINGK